MKLILDSNIFDELVNGNLDLNFIKESGYEIFITHIQVDEINNCQTKKKGQDFLIL